MNSLPDVTVIDGDREKAWRKLHEIIMGTEKIALEIQDAKLRHGMAEKLFLGTKRLSH